MRRPRAPRPPSRTRRATSIASSPDRTGARMRERAAYLLESSPVPLSSARLAKDLLGVEGGSEVLLHSLVQPLLAGDPRFEHRSEGGWSLSEPRGADVPDPPRTWTWAVWAASPHLTSAAVVRLEGGAPVAERFEPGGRASAGADPDDASFEERDGANGEEERYGLNGLRGGDPRAPGASRLRRRSADGGAGAPALSVAAIRRLRRAAGGGAWATAEPSPLFARLHDRLRSAGDDHDRRDVVSVLRLAPRALGGARPRSIESLAACLGVPLTAAEHPLGRARLTAECLARLLESGPIARVRSLPELLALRNGPRPTAPDLTEKGFDASDLRSLPAEPGVYRFYDPEGALLYVGKARNLRARVGSYFAPRTLPDPRTSPWLARVHTIEIDPSGSELEALLREADLIARAAPRENTQRVVHDRGAPPGAHLVLLLPAARRGLVRAHLIRDGTPAAKVLLGPRGRGRGRLLALLDALYFRGGPGPRGSREPAHEAATQPVAAGLAGRPSSGGSRRGAPTPAAARSGRARALLASWLRRQEDPLLAFDPTDAPTAQGALEIALRYAESVRRGEGPVIHR